jgi:glutathione S-transferase
MQAFEQAACIELATFDMLLTGWFRAGVETVFFHWPINERQGHGLLTNYMYRSYFQKDNPYPDEVMVVRLRERISEILDVLDGILSRQEYMGGDVSIDMTLHRWKMR